LTQTIIEEYNDVNDELNEVNNEKDNEKKEQEDLYEAQRKQLNIDHEELLRIHYFFDEIVIEGILDELMSLIGEKEINDLEMKGQKDSKDTV
jgi:hypothetical protein